MSLQEALRLLRLDLGMTQEDLAKGLGKAFITVNRWENGKGFPSRRNAKAILALAQRRHASEDCVSYLSDVLMPDAKRCCSAAAYGFPEIDRDFLFQLADGLTNGLYVIEAGTYHLLYANRKAEKMAIRYSLETGASPDDRRLWEQTDRRCFRYFGNRDKPCAFCPLGKLDADGYRDVTVAIPETGRKMRLHARLSEMQDRPVYIIHLTDITQEDTERHALYELTNDIPIGVGIYHLYLDGRIELAFMNSVLFELIGEERSKALRQNDRANVCLIRPEEKKRLLAEVQASVAEKRRVRFRLHMRVREGRDQPFLLDARLIRRDSGRLTYYCLFHEIDESSEEG